MTDEDLKEEDFSEEDSTPTKKPIHLLDLAEDETTVPVLFRMSKTTYKKIGQIALDRETSRVQLVREAIHEYLKVLEKPEEQEIIIGDRQLDKVLEACEKEGGGFEIDGENGFIAIMEGKGFKFKDLTPNQWEKVREKLQIGLNGYWNKPSLEEFAEKFADLEPSEEQTEWLTNTETEEETEAEE